MRTEDGVLTSYVVASRFLKPDCTVASYIANDTSSLLLLLLLLFSPEKPYRLGILSTPSSVVMLSQIASP